MRENSLGNVRRKPTSRFIASLLALMKIAIDAHHVGSRMTGSETYVYNLVKNLALLEPNGEKYAVYLESDQSVEGMKTNPCFQRRTIQTSRAPVRFGLFY